MRAPGKVNLALAVGRRQEDGYHPLATVFQAVSVYEELDAWDADGGDRLGRRRGRGPGASRAGQPRRPGGAPAGRGHRRRAAGAPADPQGGPGGRWDGRRVRRRRGRAPRVRRALGDRAEPRPARRAGGGPRLRRAVRPARAHRGRPGPRRPPQPVADPRAVPLGLRAAGAPGCRRRGSTPRTTRWSAARRRVARTSTTSSSVRCGRAMRPPSELRSATTSRSRPSSWRPSSPRPWPSPRTPGRSASS